MRIARRSFLVSAVASVAAPGVLRHALADAPPIALKLHHAFSAVSGGHDRFLAPWARKVEAESDGRLRIDLFPSMQLGGAPAQLLDQVRDGVADMVWATPGSTPGRYLKIETFELPFLLSHRALVNSRALEDFAAANLRDEFGDIHPLCFSCRDRGVLHTARPVGSLDDLKGLRLHVPNRIAGEAVQALGARGVAVPMPQVPMALAGRVIDGCLDPWDVVPGLRLNDVLKNHTDFADAALSTATFVLAMNKNAYDRLPRDLKTVIDNNSGQVAAGMAGAMWDLDAKAVAANARERGDAITIVAADAVAPWRRATEPVVAAWQKQMKERKLDGGKLVDSVHALLAKYADEPEPQPPQPAKAQSSQQNVVNEPQRAPQSDAELPARPKTDAPPAGPPPKNPDVPQ